MHYSLIFKEFYHALVIRNTQTNTSNYYNTSFTYLLKKNSKHS